ncbi:MAG: hypothetical protein ACI8ZM_005500 [Crocinitomix sp.]|jgi:hypothetical protein
MKQIYTVTIALLIGLSAFSQTPVKLKINHKLKDQSFGFNQASTNNLGNDFNVKRLEYYISGISLVHDSGKITTASDVYILVNAGAPVTVDLGQFDITNLEAINFSIGVDPGVNNADPTKWDKAHALSPKSPSMHWGWSAGYRFVALEGKTGSSLSTVFEIHALGNDNFFKINIPTKGKMENSELVVALDADYTKAIKDIDVSSGLVIHGETDQATRLLRNFANDVFTSEEGNKNTLGIKHSLSNNKISLFPNPSTGTVRLVSETLSLQNSRIELFDLTGQSINFITKTFSNDVSIGIEEKGIYIVSIITEQGAIVRKKIIIE